VRRLGVFAVLLPVVVIAAGGLAVSAGAAPLPDLTVTADSSITPSVMRGTSSIDSYAISGTAADASAAVTVPAGFSLGKVAIGNGPALACTTTGAIATCDLGAISTDVQLNVAFTVKSSTAIGSQQSIKVDVEPVPGPDANPVDNVATVSVTVAGYANLRQSATPKPLRLAKGATSVVHIVVTNDGPDAATHVAVRLGVPSGPGVITLTKFSSAQVTAGNGGFSWALGTAPAHSNTTLDVTDKALVAGGSAFLAYSTAADGIIEVCSNVACESGIQVTTVAAAVATPTRTISVAPRSVASSAVSPTPSPTSDPLADTGAPTGGLSLLGLAALLLGTGLTLLGRRRAGLHS
jgi:hypothetical protein